MRRLTLARHRRRRSHIAATLVLSLATLRVLHGADPGHDVDNPMGVVVSHAAPAPRALSQVPDRESRSRHCLACHAARSFRPQAHAKQLRPFHEAATVSPVEIVMDSSAAAHAHAYLRGPPAAFAFVSWCGAPAP